MEKEQLAVIVEPKELAARIRSCRKEKGLNQGEVAARAGVVQQTLSQWELGDVPETLPAFARVALAIGETPDSLLLVADQEAHLVKEREGASPQLLEDLLEITRQLMKQNEIAESQGPGKLPSTIFAQHVKQLTALLQKPAAWQRPAPPPLPTAEEVERINAGLLAVESGLAVGTKAEIAVSAASTLLDRLTADLRCAEQQHARSGYAASAPATAPASATPKQGRKKSRS